MPKQRPKGPKAVDVVIDTNVLVHAKNPAVWSHDDAKSFLVALLAGQAKWCMDEGFSWNEADNQSFIYSEYRRKLIPTDLGLSVLAKLARTRRVAIAPKCSRDVRDRIRALVPANPVDCRFAQTAAESQSGMLVSHDVQDFPDRVRAAMRGDRELRVDILHAFEAAPFV